MTPLIHRLAMVAAGCALTLAPSLGRAQGLPPAADTLVSDRPDFTESTDIVHRGRVQFEGGFSYEGDGTGGATSRAMTVPAALMRVGVSPRVELRLGSDGLISSRVGGARTTGYADVELGAKVRLFDASEVGVDLAVLPMVSMPSGNASMSSGGTDPTVKLTWARDLPLGFGLSGNLNSGSVSDGGTRFAQHAVSVSAGHDLLAGLGSYVEVYRLSRLGPDDGAAVTVNGGLSRAIGRDLQLDLEVGRGVTVDAPDWFVGFGFTVRTRR